MPRLTISSSWISCNILPALSLHIICKNIRNPISQSSLGKGFGNQNHPNNWNKANPFGRHFKSSSSSKFWTLINYKSRIYDHILDIRLNEPTCISLTIKWIRALLFCWVHYIISITYENNILGINKKIIWKLF